MHHGLKEKTIISITLGTDKFLCVSHHETRKKKRGTPFKLPMKVQLRYKKKVRMNDT